MVSRSLTLEYIQAQKEEAKAIAEEHFRLLDGPIQKLNDLVEEKTHLDLLAEIKQVSEPVLRRYLEDFTPFRKRQERRDRIMGSLGISNMEELPLSPIEKIDKYTDAYIRKSGFIVSLTGSVGAVGGIGVGLLELPVLMKKGFETMEEVCESFGYNSEDYFERLYLVMVLLFSLIPDSESRKQVYAKMKLIEGWIRQTDISSSEKQSFYPPEEASDFCSGHLSSALVINRIYQAVPLAGAFLGATMNYSYVNRLGKNARNFYKRRFLETRLGLNP